MKRLAAANAAEANSPILSFAFRIGKNKRKLTLSMSKNIIKI
jgi:hypothetical protein